jgi:hypothetical protein
MSNAVDPLHESSISMDDVRVADKDFMSESHVGLEPDEDPDEGMNLPVDLPFPAEEPPDDEIAGFNIGLRLRRAYRDARNVNFEHENVESMDLEEPDLFTRFVG